MTWALKIPRRGGACDEEGCGVGRGGWPRGVVGSRGRDTRCFPARGAACDRSPSSLLPPPRLMVPACLPHAPKAGGRLPSSWVAAFPAPS